MNILQPNTKATITDLDGNTHEGVILSHGNHKKTGDLYYKVSINRVVGFQGWSGGARPVKSSASHWVHSRSVSA